MLEGERYYEGNHDILQRNRTVIGQDGKLQIVDNLPNNRIVDNQYKKMVDQKNNYLLGQPISFQTENEAYSEILKEFFNKKFQRLMKNIGEESLNNGTGVLDCPLTLFLNVRHSGTKAPPYNRLFHL